MTVREMLARIDSRELTEWMLFYNLEPWGTETEDFRAGIVASTIANVNRDPQKGQPFRPDQFMPRRTEPEEQSPEEIQRALALWSQVLDRR